jgi:2-hydroxycyclohexanecarboxyl-CoA dehydrogenase
VNEPRRALVTGASGGIGAAVARELSRDGVLVAACASTPDRARRAAAELPGAEPYFADLSRPEEVARLLAEVTAGGSVDILVCCAGWERVEPFFQTEPTSWDRLLAVNLRAVIQLSHGLLPPMTERRWGRLVCIASDAGRAGSPGEAVYAAAKAGVIGFCKTLGQELGRRGVTCNAVSPGPTNTRLLKEFQNEQPGRAERLRKRIPAGRFGEPEDVAALVGFLCSDRAGYLNAQAISVNGGLHSP